MSKLVLLAIGAGVVYAGMKRFLNPDNARKAGKLLKDSLDTFKDELQKPTSKVGGATGAANTSSIPTVSSTSE